MKVFKETVAIYPKELDRINRLLAIHSFEEMDEKARKEQGIKPGSCEGVLDVQFADGSILTWDLCSDSSNYYDNVVWSGADGMTDITLVPSRKLEDIEVEIEGNLYVVELEIESEEPEEARERAVKHLTTVAEKLGWEVHRGETDTLACVDITRYSSAGGEVFYSLNFDDMGSLTNEARSIYEGFDKEDYVLTWLEGKRSGVSGVPDVRTLVVDAEEIQNELHNLVVALEQEEAKASDEPTSSPEVDMRKDIAEEIFDNIENLVREWSDYFQQNGDIRESSAIMCTLLEISKLKKKYTDKK